MESQSTTDDGVLTGVNHMNDVYYQVSLKTCNLTTLFKLIRRRFYVRRLSVETLTPYYYCLYTLVCVCALN